jgi:hypothetical protein
MSCHKIFVKGLELLWNLSKSFYVKKEIFNLFSHFVKLFPAFGRLSNAIEPDLLLTPLSLTVSYWHRLNMELDLQSLFGLQVHSCTHWLRPSNPSPPPAFGLTYEGAIGQPRWTASLGEPLLTVLVAAAQPEFTSHRVSAKRNLPICLQSCIVISKRIWTNYEE